MKFALFAARKVGLEIAKFFRDNHEPIACLVLDSKEDAEINSEILQVTSGIANNVIYSDSLYENRTLGIIVGLDLDIAILAWWPYILKEDLIKIPRIGCLNFHPSYLPYNRGKHYNFWTLVEGTPFGVTLHFVDRGIDTGDIAYQMLIEKSWEDTGESLYFKAQEKIVQLFKEKFKEIKSGQIPRRPQGQGSFHKGNELDLASRIDLDKTYTARELLNLIRARTFKPHPAVWFVDEGTRYEVRVEITRIDSNKEIS